MSTSHYYLAASLPMLEFGLKAPISYERFLDDCRRLLTPPDRTLIEQTTLTPGVPEPASNPFLNVWNRFKHCLHNELARYRAQKVGKDAADFLRGENFVDPFAAEHVSQAAKASDPLATEKSIDRYIWQFIDESTAGHFFDLEFILGYALKLQILERHKAFDSDAGAGKLEEYKTLDHKEP